jgi:hypothetical protein
MWLLSFPFCATKRKQANRFRLVLVFFSRLGAGKKALPHVQEKTPFIVKDQNYILLGVDQITSFSSNIAGQISFVFFHPILLRFLQLPLNSDVLIYKEVAR